MIRKIEDIERETGDSFDEAIEEYVESCIRTGHTDPVECAKSFMKDNGISKEDYYQTLDAVKKCFGNW